MAELLQGGGRDQGPDEVTQRGDLGAGLDARGRGDGHSSRRLGQRAQGPSFVCASCMWARVRPPVSCSAAREPSGCRVRRGIQGRARAARAAGVGGKPRGMEAFQPLTSHIATCMCPDGASTRLVDLGRGADLYPESRGGRPQIQVQKPWRRVPTVDTAGGRAHGRVRESQFSDDGSGPGGTCHWPG